MKNIMQWEEKNRQEDESVQRHRTGLEAGSMRRQVGRSLGGLSSVTPASPGDGVGLIKVLCDKQSLS